MRFRTPTIDATPLAPSRRRFDPDTFVGVACMLMLPIALMLA